MDPEMLRQIIAAASTLAGAALAFFFARLSRKEDNQLQISRMAEQRETDNQAKNFDRTYELALSILSVMDDMVLAMHDSVDAHYGNTDPQEVFESRNRCVQALAAKRSGISLHVPEMGDLVQSWAAAAATVTHDVIENGISEESARLMDFVRDDFHGHISELLRRAIGLPAVDGRLLSGQELDAGMAPFRAISDSNISRTFRAQVEDADEEAKG